MKKNLLLLVFIITASLQSNAQPIPDLFEEKRQLQAFVQKISADSGIFQRVIKKIDVDRTVTYSAFHDFTPYLEYHYIHLKFSKLGPVEEDTTGTPYSIGQVFMSERYIESDYYDVFRSAKQYRDDKDGFFYYCKIYFDIRNNETRINIYPNYLSNICDKFMHLNDKPCLKGDSPTHDYSIRKLIAIPDIDYINFLAKNNLSGKESRKRYASREIEHFNAHNTSKANFHPLFSADSAKSSAVRNSTIGKRVNKYTLRSFVNLSKEIKVFTVNRNKHDTNEISLKLIHSKRQHSEDFSDHLHYDFDFKSYEDLGNNISEFVEYTNNVSNRRIEYSEKPDDEFISGKKRIFNQIAFSDQQLSNNVDTTIINGCRNATDGFIACLNRYKISLTEALRNFDRDLEDEKQRNANVNTEIANRQNEKNRELRSILSDLEAKKTALINIYPVVRRVLPMYNLFNGMIDSLSSSLSLIPRETIQTEPNLAKAKEIVNVFVSGLDSVQLAIERILPDRSTVPAEFEDDFPNFAPYQDLKSMVMSAKYSDMAYKLRTNSGAYKLKFGPDELNALKARFDSKLSEMNSEIKKAKQDLMNVDLALSESDSSYTKTKSNYVASKSVLSDLSSSKIIFMTKLSEINLNIEQFNARNLRQTTGFTYLSDPGLVDEFRAINSEDKLKKQIFFYNLFQKSRYVRKSIPVMLSKDIYHKGEICQIYEPYNFNKLAVKQYFKGRIPHGSKLKWKKLMESELMDALVNCKFDTTVLTVETETLTEKVEYLQTVNFSNRNLANIYAEPKAIRLVDVKIPETNDHYYWLRIPQNIIDNMPYLNFLFNYNLSSSPDWRVQYADTK